MALLLLWEVDHGQPYPPAGARGLADTLMNFARRLKARVQADPELSGWLESRKLQVPLSPGLVASLKITPPPSPSLSYIAGGIPCHPSPACTHASPSTCCHPCAPYPHNRLCPGGGCPLGPTNGQNPGRTAPKKRPCHAPVTALLGSNSSTPSPCPRTRPPSPSGGQLPPTKRKTTLQHWLRPAAPADAVTAVDSTHRSPCGSAAQELARHGRATQGPPT